MEGGERVHLKEGVACILENAMFFFLNFVVGTDW